MTHQEIADEIKEIVVTMYAREPENRDWYVELGKLIDKLEEADNG